MSEGSQVDPKMLRILLFSIHKILSIANILDPSLTLIRLFVSVKCCLRALTVELKLGIPPASP